MATDHGSEKTFSVVDIDFKNNVVTHLCIQVLIVIKNFITYYRVTHQCNKLSMHEGNTALIPQRALRLELNYTNKIGIRKLKLNVQNSCSTTFERSNFKLGQIVIIPSLGRGALDTTRGTIMITMEWLEANTNMVDVTILLWYILCPGETQGGINVSGCRNDIA